MPPHAAFFAWNYAGLRRCDAAPNAERHIVVPVSLQIWRVPTCCSTHRTHRHPLYSARKSGRGKSTLTRGAALQYALTVKRGWWLTGILCVTTGVVAYAAANRRASALETYLDRMTLEQDSLRTVMAEQAYMLERVTDARMSDGEVGEVERLRAQLDQTTTFLNEARSTADERSRAFDTQQATLRECSDVQGRLEQQLEACIFGKAAFEKRARAGTQPTGQRPTSGSSAFSQSIEFPAEAGD